MAGRFTICFLVCAISLMGYSQITIGLPEAGNYSKRIYGGGAQTRQVAQDENGILYFANEEGLLTFNSSRWKLYALPNKSFVRCLKFGPDGKLYVGGQDEFGYFIPAQNGSLAYHSLKNLLPPSTRSFADVWEICFANNAIFFQTSERIYELKGQQIKIFSDTHWRFMGMAGRQLVAQSGSKGLLFYTNGSWIPNNNLKQNDLPPDYFVTSITTIGKDSNLITTLKHGVYLFSVNKIVSWAPAYVSKLKDKNLSAALMVNEDQLAIGTNLDGCFILDKKGNLVQHFGRKEGLQDNSIFTIFLDQQKNIWFGLHNGIDFIPYNNAIKHINPPSIYEGAGFSSILFKNNLYLGTSIGLFQVPINGQQYISSIHASAVEVKNTAGEVWNLSEVNGELLMGHNEGAFSIKNGAAIPIDKNTGYWNFQPAGNASPKTLMIAGTYKGIAYYNYADNRFTKLPYEATVESARFVINAFNRVWFSHPYKGIYAVTAQNGKTSHKKYNTQQGVFSNNNNYLFKIKNRLLLTTDNGVFFYNAAKDIFEPDAFYNQHLPRYPIRYLKEDTEGNIWFVFEKKVGVLDISGKQPQVIYFPELTNKFVAGFEHINPIDKNNILLGGEKGFYHIDLDQYKQLRYPLQILIGSVTAINQKDSLLYGGYSPSGFGKNNGIAKTLTLGPAYNSLRFEFASALYGQVANIEYSYYLEGYEKDWLEFTGKTEKEYTNLAPGKYIFKVKARNNLGNESAVSQYVFTILPPWYKTKLAFLLYALLVAFGMYTLVRYQKKKFAAQQEQHEKEQQKLQYLHQLEIDKAEKELVELRNAKLEMEIIHKNSELASTAMHLVQKTDVLLKIKEQMTKLKDQTVAADTAPDLKKILRTLNEEHKMEEQWQQFSIHFDSVHHNFLATLKKKHPDLTPNEQKLCAYLKMNLSTKEIAQLMNISGRGVEISRYRLRKKLGVPAGVHLFNFLDAVSLQPFTGT